ncbi:MAG: hypothetical protein OXT73_11005 [Bacteroidota bacterium]|nr:hypothetical protein [Bacteroidota bacterium]
MELDILFWLAIAAIYIIQSIASRRKQVPGGPDGMPVERDGEELPEDLETALGEIGRILRGESPEIQPRRAPEPGPVDFHGQPLPPPKPVQRPKPKATPSEWKGASSGESTFYDEAFENRRAPLFKAPVITHDHTFSFQSPDEDEESKAIDLPDLKSKEALKQAFITTEILSPPVSRRRR